jgi:hypothetical protein
VSSLASFGMLNSVLELDACDYCVKHSIFALAIKYPKTHLHAHQKYHHVNY